MKISYQFLNGEHCEIDVDDCWAKELAELDRIEYNVNQKETRRHCSLDVMDYEGKIFADCKDVFSEVFADHGAEERLHTAILKLKPKQQELIKAIYFDSKSEADIAKALKISQQAVSQQLITARKKLKNFFEKPCIMRFP